MHPCDDRRSGSAGHHQLARHPVARALWLGAGFLFVGLGAIGVVLPLLPTTPFVLLAAYCFARSSPRFYAWLLRTRTFGPLIRDWRAGLGIPLRAKVLAVALLALTLGSSIAMFVSSWPVRILLATIGLAVAWFVLSRPTAPRRPPAASRPARRTAAP